MNTSNSERYLDACILGFSRVLQIWLLFHSTMELDMADSLVIAPPSSVSTEQLSLERARLFPKSQPNGCFVVVTVLVLPAAPLACLQVIIAAGSAVWVLDADACIEQPLV